MTRDFSIGEIKADTRSRHFRRAHAWPARPLAVGRDGLDARCHTILLAHLRLRFLQEHYVGIGMRSEYAQVLAIGRPAEIDDLLGIEICDLAAWRTIQRLQPHVVDSVGSD